MNGLTAIAPPVSLMSPTLAPSLARGAPAAPAAPTYGPGQQFAPVYLGTNPGDKNYAANTFANLTREQWQRYITEIVPYEDKLIDYATDPTVVSDAMSEASLDVNRVFDLQKGTNERRLRGLGLTLSADEARVSDRLTGLARGLADVDAQNRARDQVRARQDAILGNPAPRVGGLGG